MAFDPSTLGPWFRYDDGLVGFMAGSGAQFLPANPYRVALILQGITAAIVVRPILQATANLGFQMPVNQPPVVLPLNQYGTLIQQIWTGFSSSGGSVYFIEVLWQPSGD